MFEMMAISSGNFMKHSRHFSDRSASRRTPLQQLDEFMARGSEPPQAEKIRRLREMIFADMDRPVTFEAGAAEVRVREDSHPTEKIIMSQGAAANQSATPGKLL